MSTRARRGRTVYGTAALAAALTGSLVVTSGLGDGPPTAGAATASGTVTFRAVADTYVQSTTPARAYGSAARLGVDASPTRRTYVRFAVSGLTGAVTRATLRVHTVAGNAGAPSGGTWRRVASTTWPERTTTWANRPALGGTLGSIGAVTRGTWYSVDVTAAVLGNGTYSFGATSASGDGAYYDSRETAYAPRLVVTTGDPVLVGAGDIAADPAGGGATAALLDTVAGTVFTAGDNYNGPGPVAEYGSYYGPTWGRHKARTRPAPGNHDYYGSADAAAYFGYFGSAAGPAGEGWYSYDLGEWHVVALNSNAAREAGSAQEQWLRADLAASTKRCTLAYWHHPRFTSGAEHGPDLSTDALFRALYEHGAELVVSGHNHQYERFAPQGPDGRADPAGVRQFVVGTGGAPHYAFGAVQPNSQVRRTGTWGVLKLTLRAGGYAWRFVPEAGRDFTDSGTASCH